MTKPAPVGQPNREPRTLITRPNRRLGLATLTAAVLLLTGCSSSSDDGDAAGSASPTCAEFPDGDAAQAVTVEGDFGEEPTVSIDGPLEASEIQAHTVTTGDGDVTEAGDNVSLVISVFSAETGEVASSQSADLVVSDASMYPAFTAAIECRPVGSRVVTVVPADQLYGETGNEALGIAANETVIFVTDIKEINEPPTVEEWTEDVPEVSFDDDGVPTISLPGTEAPDGVRVKVLEEGDGATVAATDQVTLAYQGIRWKDGKVFDQSYGSQAATFPITGVIPGFSAAVVGQKVGTQLLVSIPSEYAYAEGSGSELAGQDLVFLIDIKGIGSASATPSESAS